MTRNTHDIVNDHFGTLEAEQIATGTPTIGYAPISTGAGAPPAWGVVSSGGSGVVDILTGNSSLFTSGVGSWTSSAGATSYDTTSGHSFLSLAGSFKWSAANNTTDYVSCPVSGTFLAGVEYHAVIAVALEDSTPGGVFSFQFGLVGTDSATTQVFVSSASDWKYILVLARWTPTADRTGVTLKLRKSTSTGSNTIHVGYARVVNPGGTLGLAQFIDGRLFNYGGSSSFKPHILMPYENDSGTNLTSSHPAGASGSFIGPRLWSSGNSLGLGGGGDEYAYLALYSNGNVYFTAGDTAGNLNFRGFNFEVGPDFVGFIISEKDASTIQLYDDAGGAYDLELVDQGSFGWKTSGANGNVRLQKLIPTTINFVIDGGGSVITTGIKGDLELPFDGEIKAVTLLGDQSGSIVVNLWRDTYANFPPTVADKITASAPPTISGATKSRDTTLTGWTKTFSAGDILRVNVDSVTTIQRVTLSLTVNRT